MVPRLSLFEDIDKDAAIATMPAGIRMVFVVHGAVTIDAREFRTGAGRGVVRRGSDDVHGRCGGRNHPALGAFALRAKIVRCPGALDKDQTVRDPGYNP